MRQGGIVGIYLAAGLGTRMGQVANKLALPVGEWSLGSIALRTAFCSKLDHVIIVTREESQAEWIDPVLRAEPFSEKWTLAVCAEAAKGLAHSLRCGVRAALARGASGVVVLLADQPFISSEMIDQLIGMFQQDPWEPPLYVASSHQGLIQPPLFFAAELFPDLLQLQGDEGARKLLRRQLEGIEGEREIWGKTVEFADARAFFDVDTRGRIGSLANF